MRKNSSPKNQYLQQVFAKDDPVGRGIQDWARKDKVDYMQISSYEGGILQFLCQALKVKKVVEIGSLYGYSSLMIARALPSDGQIFSLDINSQRQAKAKELISGDPAGAKVHFIAGAAKESLKNLESQAPFDMVFIDADKNAYLDYLHWSSRHLKSGGLLVADNTFLFGGVYGEGDQDPGTVQIMQAFNKEVAQSGLYVSTLIPTEEGLTVGIKK